MSMELVLPARERPDRGEPLASPRRAQKWLAEVRHGGDRESSRRYIEGIQRFNRIELRLAKRLKIAELLRPTARYVIDRLEQRISTRKLPLDDVSRRNFTVLLLLLRETALAYDICAAELAGQRRPSTRTLALVIERALFYRGETMLGSAPVHSPLPQNFWHDSNALIREAEARKCVDKRVHNGELLARRQKQSPREMYKRLLLFAVAPTDGLRRGQAERLFRRTEAWAPLATMTSTAPEPSNTLFCVDLDRPEGPHAASSESEPPPSLRWIEFAPVLAAAQKMLPEAPPEGAVLERDQVDATTLQRLIDSWSVHSGRAGERIARDEAADVEVSLRDIHARLFAETAPPGEQPSGPRSEPVSSVSALALQTIEASERRWRQLDDEDETLQPIGETAPPEPAKPDPADQQARNWLLIESGGGGFRLRWQSSESSAAVVGDLVALHEQGSGGPDGNGWTLGTIRRIRMIDEQRFDAGVQTLGFNPVAARLRHEPANPHRKRDRASEASEPALLLPADRTRKTPATVLVGANTFQDGDVVELDLPGRMVRVTLAPAREHSSAYSRFRLEKPPARGRSAKGGGEEDEPM
ncbi:MAG: hypothetical protein U5K33_02140 [Halofilum sp. (in: g-proteobacteria)]|nr:hypothetical protein [Halofilum sp. (in: g-proteobacteria)]